MVNLLHLFSSITQTFAVRPMVSEEPIQLLLQASGNPQVHLISSAMLNCIAQKLLKEKQMFVCL